MNAHNAYAVIGMFAIVITLYALKESHTHYLPDFFGLALATTAPRPIYAIGAVCLVALIRHSPLASGLAGGMPSWLLVIVLPGARNMSISDRDAAALEEAYKARILAENSNQESVEILRPVAENDDEMITLGENRALARLVAAEQVGLTIAVQVGAKAKSGAKYQKRTKQIKAEVERLRNHYPPGSNLTQFK